LSGVLAAPEKADFNAVRDGALFNYNMFAYIDGDFLNKAVDYIQKGGKPGDLKAAGIVPDMMKRGAVRSATMDATYSHAISRRSSTTGRQPSKTSTGSTTSSCSISKPIRSR